MTGPEPKTEQTLPKVQTVDRLTVPAGPGLGAGVTAGTTLAFIGLGANLGDPQLAVLGAMHAIASVSGVHWLCASSLYGSAPVDAGGPDYVNAVAAVATTLQPEELLDALQRIEQAAGRLRPYQNAPRTLDLDVLLFGDAPVCTARLTVPHPRMWQRAFVLLPLAEIAPERVPQQYLHAVQEQPVWRLDSSV